MLVGIIYGLSYWGVLGNTIYVVSGHIRVSGHSHELYICIPFYTYLTILTANDKICVINASKTV